MNDKRSTYSLWTDPLGQAALSGALALIPARRYPPWVRGAMIWGSTVSVTGLALAPGAATAALKRLGQWQGVDPAEHEEMPSPSPAVRAGVALAAGAVMYGTWRLAFWSDEAAERGLRALRIPFPRVVMGVAAGVTSWYGVRGDNRRRAESGR